jgi:endonuclease/exonuclease/phosphatase family metal-dependent hydrolase
MIIAEIDIGGSHLSVISTHFTHVDEQDQERNIQASAILDAWSQTPATIFMGDLNARPDSDAIRILVENGFVDISAEIGTQPTYTYYSANPDHQIDYIFASSDLDYRDFEIIQTTASDHLPLVVVIDLP